MGISEFLGELKELLDTWQIIEDPALLTGYERDYWPLIVGLEYSGRWTPTPPKATVLVDNEENVETVVYLAYKHKVPLVPYAGGTGVLGGAIPLRDSVVVDVSPMNDYGWYDEEALVVYADAGTPLKHLEEWLNSEGYTLRHFPQSYPTALIGGLVATKSIGQYSTGYGGIEDIVLGLHIATYKYGLVKVRPVPRRSVLWSLKHMFVGSEGLLGIITRVYLQAKPLPECIIPLAYEFESFELAIKRASRSLHYRITPEILRIYDETESQAMFGVEKSLMIAVVEGLCDIVDARLKLMNKLLEKEPIDSTYAEKWLNERFNVIEKIRDLAKIGLAFDTIEVAGLWGNLLKIHSEIVSKAPDIDGVMYASAHASHFYYGGAALYFTVVFDMNKLPTAYNEVWDLIETTTAKYGGTISHHHGIGLHRLKWITLDYGENGLNLLKDVKKAIDPEGIFRDKIV